MFLKEKLLSGQKIYGTMLRVVRNPAICMIAKNAGLDFVLFDCEHAAYNMETLHDLFITGNAYGLECYLRVPDLTKDYISRALDQGARGVMVPMLETAEMAKTLVDYSKYLPVGNRGYASGIPHVDYVTGGKHTDVMAEANKKVLTIAQIETKLSVDNAEAIASTPGIDAIIIGPNDLSISLGIPGDLFNPIEIEAISHVIAACKKNNVAFGLHGPAKLIEHFIDGINICIFQTDIDILTNGLKNCKETILNFEKK